jgi:PAS domain S-box-containing protein
MQRITASGRFPQRPPLRGLLRHALWVCCALAVLGAPPTPAATADQTRPVLTAAVPVNLPPISARGADGTPSGFAVEVLRRVAENAGYGVRLIPAENGEEAVRLLLAGKVQVAPGLGWSERREKLVAFTQVIETLPVHIYFRADGPRYESLSDLDGRKVSLVAGALCLERLGTETRFVRHTAASLPEALFAVLSGETEALIHSAPLVEFAARATGAEDRLEHSHHALFEVGRAIAVRRDQPDLRNRLDAALGAFRATEEFRELYRRWHAPPQRPIFDPTALWTMAALAVALTALLLAWRYISLLRVNRRLTTALSERDQALAALGLTRERLESLFTLAHMETAGIDELTRFALEEGVRLTGSEVGYLVFPENDAIDLTRIRWSSGARDSCSVAPRGEYPLEQAGVWAECIQSKAPRVINDYSAYPYRRGLPPGHVPVRRHMAVPLIEDGRVTAIFGVGNKAAPYDANDTRQLQLFLSGLGQVLRARRDAQAIREARDYAESLIQGANALIVGLDKEGRITMFNAAAQAATGYALEDVRGRPWWEVLQPAEDGGKSSARYLDFMAGRAALPRQHESVLRTKSGASRHISWQISLLTHGEDVSGVIAFGIDITERKAAQTELMRLYQAIEQSAEGVLVIDAAGRVIFANAAVERLSGLKREDLLRDGCSLLDLDASLFEHQASIIKSAEAEGVWRGSCTFVAAGRDPVELEFTVTAMRSRDKEPACYVTVCRDVTEKRALEQQLWQAQKMEALGTLAGGVAHDFNNILASILGFTELALEDLPPGSRARSCLERVLKASTRARELVRQILTFSRRGERCLRVLRVEAVVAESLKLLEASLPKNVTINTRFEAADCAVLADPSQIHQIVMNLCTNAAQAMRGQGGALTVRTSAGRLPPEQAARHRLPPGDYFTLSVEDQGPGIAPEVLGRVFDPFFTTKGPGEGTGLGLSVVHGVAASLGGTVLAESEPGRGARFSVLLPVREDEPECVQEEDVRIPTGQGRILLVDDEPDLLDLGRQTLEPLGYQVTTTNDPEAALRAFTAKPAAVDLVVTDQSMPRLTGLMLAEAVRRVRADLPIVLITGYSMAIPPDRLDALGAVRLLSKPFSTGDLARTVGQALAGGQGAEHGLSAGG